MVSLTKPNRLVTLELMDLDLMVETVSMVKGMEALFRLEELVELALQEQMECLLAVRVVKARM